VDLFPGTFYRVVPTAAYLVFHNVAEFFAVMVALSIFGVAWYSHEQTRDRHALFLGTAFLAIGLMDFMHTLSYSGMPDFVTPSSANKASQFWVVVRSFAAVAFLASAFVRADAARPWLRKGLLGAVALAVPAVAFVAIVLFPEHVPAAYVPGVGQTAFKRFAEYAIVAVLVAAIAAQGWRRARSGDPSAALYGAAFALSAFSELFFAAYRSVTDTRNLLGHVYKVAAFYLVYRGMFVGSIRRPHQRLLATTEALRREMAERTAAEARLARSAQALEHERDRVTTIMEASPVAMMRLEREGRVAYVNAAAERILGASREEITRRRFDSPEWIVTDEAGGQLAPEELPFAVLARTHAPVRRRLAIAGPSGRRVLLDVTGAPLFDAAGAFDGVVMGLEDITERSVVEEQLRQSQKMEAVGRLAGGVAHDFNNLLTAILGASDQVLEQLPAGSTLREDARDIQLAARKAAALTRQLLTFSRKQVVVPKVVALDELVAGLVQMLQRLIGEDVQLVARHGPAVGNVRADPGQLEQVVVNLVVNARDAMPEGGRITLETADFELGPQEARAQIGVRPGRYVMLAVSDTGCGMSAEVLSHLFEPFFTTKGPGKGTGLGLSTIYGIVKQAGGHVRVESAVGAGSTFRVYLPRVEDGAAAVEGRAGAAAAAAPATVLLVEDEPQVRAVVLKVLRRAGHAVLDAADGEEALRRAADPAQVIDVLVTDVVMPHLGGRELATRIRALRPGLKVLFVSGYVDAGFPVDELDDDTRFLQKPFGPAELATELSWLLTRAPRKLAAEP
jgi:PAS domain S-box-containing protein